jgi:hypothetical protein
LELYSCRKQDSAHPHSIADSRSPSTPCRVSRDSPLRRAACAAQVRGMPTEAFTDPQRPPRRGTGCSAAPGNLP